MKHVSTKKYDHTSGFSCAFRQWKAKSHCRLIHGYPLAFEFTFEADELDENNWVVDFGSLKPVKEFLTMMFDHTYLCAQDDPELDVFRHLQATGLIDLRIIPAVGCEKTAEFVHVWVELWLKRTYGDRVKLRSTQIWEHGGNSAKIEA